MPNGAVGGSTAVALEPSAPVNCCERRRSESAPPSAPFSSASVASSGGVPPLSGSKNGTSRRSPFEKVRGRRRVRVR